MTEVISVSQPDAAPTPKAAQNTDIISRPGNDILFRIQNGTGSADDKFVYFMVNGKQSTALSITNQIDRKNLSADEQTRVWDAYAKEFPAAKSSIPSEEVRKLAEERKQKRVDAEAQNPDLAQESEVMTKSNEPPTQNPKPKKPAAKSKNGTPQKAKKAAGPH